MAGDFGTGKTVLVLAIVAGCFAVLWPKLIYPMIITAVNLKIPDDKSTSAGCCDVIFENDVNAIKIMTEMCGNILHRYDDFDPKLSQAFQQGKLSKEVVYTCRKEVLDTCGIDITAFLNEKVRLGKTYRQILDEIRSFNSSVCLKRNFGVDPAKLGAPHRMRMGPVYMPRHHRQERPPHLRPDLLNNHPALQERGRAIPQSHIVPKVIEKEGRPPGPIPGMRPPMGGAGHVVPPPKGGGGSGGTMGIIMPIYTIGIVVFFMYTMMKMVFKKPGVQQGSGYDEFSPDPVFRRMVFNDEPEIKPPEKVYEEKVENRAKRETSPTVKVSDESGTKLGDIEIDHLRRRLVETEAAMERIVAQMGTVPQKLHSSSGTDYAKAVDEIEKILEKAIIEEIQPSHRTSSQVHTSSNLTESVDNDKAGGAKVKIIGMEMTASCEGGQRWSRPGTPVLISSNSRSSTPLPPPTPEPQSIFLEGALPAQSQLLVTESETQALTGDSEGTDCDPPVILSGKMTLSLISIDGAIAAEDEHRRQKAADEKHKIEEIASSLREESTPVPAASSENDVEVEEEEEEEEEEEVEDEEEEEDDENAVIVNDVPQDVDDAPTSANYTTATSAAAEATGPEETAADFSTIDSFLPDDQEEEEDLEEEEVWNGDIDSGEEEEESEKEAEGIVLQESQQQHQR